MRSKHLTTVRQLPEVMVTENDLDEVDSTADVKIDASFDKGMGRLVRHLIAFVLLALLFWYTYLHEFLDISPLLFWAIWALIISNAVVTLLRAQSSSEQMLVLLVVLAAILLTKTPASYWPFQLRGNDDYFELNLAQSIAQTSHWDPTAGLGYAANYYGYFPGVHILIAELSIVLGVNGMWGTFMLGKYLYIPVISFAQVVLAYLLIRIICRGFCDRVLLGIVALLYLSTLGVLVIHAGRASYGDVFMLMAFYLFVRHFAENKTRSNIVLFVLASVGLAVGYHFSQYYLVVALAFAIPFMARTKMSLASPVRWLAMVAIVILGWEFFIASTVVRLDVYRYMGAIATLLFHGEVEPMSTTLAYDPFERFLPYFSQGTLIALAIVGLVALYRRRFSNKLERSSRMVVLKFISAFGLATYLITGPLITTRLFFFTYLTSTFSGIGVSILACVGLIVILTVRPASGSPTETASRWSIADLVTSGQRRLRLTVLVPIILLVIVFSGNMLIAFSARTLDRGPNDIATVEDVRNMRPEFASAGLWLYQYSRPGVTILGDRPVWRIFGGYLSMEATEGANLLANMQTLQKYRGEFDFIVLDENLGRYSSLVYPDLFPMSLNHLSSQSLNRVYSNGLVSVLVFVPRE